MICPRKKSNINLYIDFQGKKITRTIDSDHLYYIFIAASTGIEPVFSP